MQPMCVLRTQLTTAAKATHEELQRSIVVQHLDGVVDEVAVAAPLQRSLVGLQFQSIVTGTSTRQRV